MTNLSALEWNAIVAGSGAIAAWVAVLTNELRRRQSLKRDLKLRWIEIKQEREALWAPLRDIYERFRKQHPSAPSELYNLLEVCGVPKGVVSRGGRPLVHWHTEQAHSLNNEQRLLYDFVAAIYPPRKEPKGKVTENSIIEENWIDKFHLARGHLAGFWDSWLAIGSLRRHIKRNYTQVKYDTFILSWLDITLYQATPEDRDEGRTSLYRLATAFVKSKHI